MGSKVALLRGSLGDILLEQARNVDRFVDLFSGSGAVARYVAERTELPVLSVDLQEFSRVLASAVIERTNSLTESSLLDKWALGGEIPPGKDDEGVTVDVVLRERREANSGQERFITRHYGGHYFSLSQARQLDILFDSLPTSEPERTVALASLLQAASACAAAPGHTAQPFQPTQTLIPYIRQSWSKDVFGAIRGALDQLRPAHANVKGEARVGDALSTSGDLMPGDLVFCDPPYSTAQYSRFYHVLEGIAKGGWSEVSGRGRAPARAMRETSDFSTRTNAVRAMKELLDGLRSSGCRVVITFPNAEASNGLSGQQIIAMATESWKVEPHYVDAVHSTLGGGRSATGRGGRRNVREAVIVLQPKSALRAPRVTSRTIVPASSIVERSASAVTE